MTPAVEARNLTKRYKTARAVDAVNLSIPAGVCCGFLGKNGAGKTTTLKMLVGLKKPTAGEITILGRPQTFGAEAAAGIGYLPDVPNFYGYMTGAEFLHFCAKLCGIPKPARAEKVRRLLDKVGLSRARSTVAGYSRGMKQRLGIAQALINDPAVIFMDEPISALDPIGRRDVTEIIRGLKADGNTTVILSTHILADVEDVCDYVLVIEEGKIMAQDYLTNLKAAHRRHEAQVRFPDTASAEKFAAATESTAASEAGTAIFTAERTDALTFTVRLSPEATPNTAKHQPAVQPATQQTPALSDLCPLTSDLSRAVNAVLHENCLAIESYTTHSPTLEEIFYAVIAEKEPRHA